MLDFYRPRGVSSRLTPRARFQQHSRAVCDKPSPVIMNPLDSTGALEAQERSNTNLSKNSRLILDPQDKSAVLT
jgi:hypothetical protein